MNRSFDILAAEYRPMVLAYLRSLGADAHLAEDLAQETYIAAHQSLTRFEEGGNFGTWLRGIARNKALMHWRSNRRRPLIIDSRIVEGIDEVFDELERSEEEGHWWQQRREALKHCIGRLSYQLRGAITRVYTEGESLDQAAMALNSTRAAVGQRLSRARHQIRQCVAQKLQASEEHE